MADTEVFRITTGKITKRRIFDEIGLSKADLEEIAEDEKSKISKLGQQALRAKVPVDHRELRNNIVVSKTPTAHTVKIKDGVHSTSNTKSPLSNPELADLLEDGISRYGTPFKRTQRSVPAGPFGSEGKGTPTQAWASKAQDLVDKEL